MLLSQTSYLGEAQASLDSGQKHRVIASADPRFLVRCACERRQKNPANPAVCRIG
jgi:hypothetical protein